MSKAKSSDPVVDSPTTAIAGNRRMPIPAWRTELERMYASGKCHAIVLHNNVRDLVTDRLFLIPRLVKLFSNHRCIVLYNISTGIQFADGSSSADDLETSRDNPSSKTMYELFLQFTGFGQDDSSDDLTAIGLGGSRRGSSNESKNPKLPSDPGAVVPLLEKFLRNASTVSGDSAAKAEGVVIIDYAETLCPNADVAMTPVPERVVNVTLNRIGTDPDIAATGNVLILVTENIKALNASLRASSSGYNSIEVPFPDFDTRLAYVEIILSQRNLTLESTLTPQGFASETAMLMLVGIKDICLLAARENNGVVTRELIRERKRQIIAQEFGDVIETMDKDFTFDDIGGLAEVKEFFRRSVIAPMQTGNRKRVPMGVLLMGPAGTGKTIMAQAVARESGINAVALNPAKLFGKYVGDTERNLDRALRAIESMAPALVFIDEIDQMVSRGGGGGDSGVSDRFFKRLLEFFSDTTHRGKVVVLMATNRPDLMDAALKRPGRADKKLLFAVPENPEREQIFIVMSRRYGLDLAKVPPAAMSNTNGYTGAEIETIVIKAVELVEDEKLKSEKALVAASERIRASTSDIEFMTQIALSECNDLDLVPARFRDRLVNRSEIEKTVRAMKRERDDSAPMRRELND